MKYSLLYFGVLIFFFPAGLIAQPSNDNCNQVIRLPDVTKYCSKVAEFTNVNATASGYPPAMCWTGVDGDVWFSFRSFFTDVSITIIGANTGGTRGGTLTFPQVALYVGICGGGISEKQCVSDGAGRGIINLNEAGLVVGQDFFIRVNGINNRQGTFQICINNFNAPVEPGQDCNSSSILCEKVPFVNKKLAGNGLFTDEAAQSCLGETNGMGQTSEEQSVWYTWTAANNGTLTFVMNPLNPSDDLDFALYELPSGIRNCNDKILLRCNATAPRDFQSGRNCGTATGLDLTSTDLSENFNCDLGEDGFSKYIDMVQGKVYSLIINNFSATGIGFSIDWGGSGEFLGPIPEFGVFPETGLKCDTDFMVTDSSQFSTVTGNAKYTWNFGKDAIPQSSSGKGPFSIRYTSFGEKFITLTLELGGCKVTEIRRIYAEPCCEDLPTLNVVVDSIRNVSCFGFTDGKFAVHGELGTPFKDNVNGSFINYYQYSLDNITFSPYSEFTPLPKGNYTVYIQDSKGCLDSLLITITEPEPVVPDAGSDIEIELGDIIQLNGTVYPPNAYQFEWIGDSIVCRNCQNTTALPFNDGYYKFKTINANGCEGIDSIFVRVRKNYEVWAPNVFSPNNDGLNEFFRVWGGKSLQSIQLLQVYDRWGELVYEGHNLDLNQTNTGWNGMFRTKDMNPGVYVYLVRARFLDGTLKDISGDFTLLR